MTKMKTKTKMLRPGNTKLGKLVYQWSIPSGPKHICTGASTLCQSVCYAQDRFYTYQSVRAAMARNYRLTRKRNFIWKMLESIQGEFAKVVRIHASGEFHSAEYADAWIQIITKRPNTIFFAYTRAWRDPEIYPVLKRMARLPNLHLWFSCDRETGAPPVIRGVRRAYMMMDDDDKPKFKVNLCFRVEAKTVMKKVDGVLVCPYENGVTPITCSTCQLCFTRKLTGERKASGLLAVGSS